MIRQQSARTPDLKRLALMKESPSSTLRPRLHKRSEAIASGFDRIMLYKFDVLKNIKHSRQNRYFEESARR